MSQSSVFAGQIRKNPDYGSAYTPEKIEFTAIARLYCDDDTGEPVGIIFLAPDIKLEEDDYIFNSSSVLSGNGVAIGLVKG